MTSHPTEQPGRTLIGQTIGGRFRVSRTIATGGMAVIYEAEQPLGGATRKVALKTLRIHASQDPSVASRFKRECETIAQLAHPNTVRVYDFGETPDGMLYIAMEFVPGRSLAEIIHDDGPLPPLRVLNIVRQIAGALQEAHGQGIVHRDLKPDNVVISPSERGEDLIKLLDFGIAARTLVSEPGEKLTQQGIVLGTPPYMSPEQFSGEPVDARSDVYALGVMTYEMLSGDLPLKAATPWQWANEHMTTPAPPLVISAGGLPDSIRDGVRRALSKSPADRQASARIFFDELSGALPAPVSGTERMDATPSVPKTAALNVTPALSGRISSPGDRTSNDASPSTGGTPVVIGTAAPRDGGAKSLILVLTAAGALLLAGIVVVVSRSMKPASEPPPLPPLTADSAPPATIAPISSPEESALAQASGSAAAPPAPTERPAPEWKPASPSNPGPPAVPSVPGGVQPAPPRPAPTAPQPPPASPAWPAPMAFACKSNQACGSHRCVTQVGKCAFPCRSTDDCVEGFQCGPLPGMCVPIITLAPTAAPTSTSAPSAPAPTPTQLPPAAAAGASGN